MRSSESAEDKHPCPTGVHRGSELLILWMGEGGTQQEALLFRNSKSLLVEAKRGQAWETCRRYLEWQPCRWPSRAHDILQGLPIDKKDQGYRAPALGELYRASLQTHRLKEEAEGRSSLPVRNRDPGRAGQDPAFLPATPLTWSAA